VALIKYAEPANCNTDVGIGLGCALKWKLSKSFTICFPGFAELLHQELEAADRFLSHEVLKLPLSCEVDKSPVPKSDKTWELNLKFCNKT
jgi:hypothetical protein